MQTARHFPRALAVSYAEMTADEHRVRACELLAEAEAWRDQGSVGWETAATVCAQAQVHATLAQVAATSALRDYLDAALTAGDPAATGGQR